MPENKKTAERWGCLDLAFPGARDGNPFTDYTIRGTFRGEHETVENAGVFRGKFRIKTGGRPYMAVRLQKVSG